MKKAFRIQAQKQLKNNINTYQIPIGVHLLQLKSFL